MMVKFILIKSPDEWATTKQACRDELVVYLFFSPIYSSLYFNVLSTVLRTSSFTLYIDIYMYFFLFSDHTTTLTLMQKPKLDKKEKNCPSESTA